MIRILSITSYRLNNMKIYQHDLFPVPVMYVEQFLPSDFADTILQYILSLKDQIHTRHGALYGDAVSLHESNIKKNIFDLINENVPHGIQLQDNIKEITSMYATTIGHPGVVIDNSWFNIQNKNSLLKKHTHINPNKVSIVSGALYINTNQDSPPICFENPNPSMPLFVTSKELNTKYNNSFYEFEPDIGDLILFPSWLPHYTVLPNKTSNRVVISFNASYPI